MSNGLPYGWWKSGEFWASALSILGMGVMLALIIAAWFLDWKPFW